ncbi:uncharacterized protein LOC108162407 [Drosophila miranda]|uniref:uncharacterized protein LOC108162407 n=1 Tax=Drosophila miranda TaxID=7229 RepID=UPI0007E620B2|nr:uncharacterized protein LOC108162407 [Drosophila miranda]
MFSATDLIHKAIGVVGVLALLLAVSQSTARVSVHLGEGLSNMVESCARCLNSLTPVEGTPVLVDCENMGPTCSTIRRVGHRVYSAVGRMVDSGRSWARAQPNPDDEKKTRPKVREKPASKKKTSSTLQENPNHKDSRRSSQQAGHTGENLKLQ